MPPTATEFKLQTQDVSSNIFLIEKKLVCLWHCSSDMFESCPIQTENSGQHQRVGY